MKRLKILPLGGLGEIGMNCLLLEYDEQIVLLDCGIQFPDSRFPGVDILTPDLTYVRQKAKQVRGVVITHGHEDHIGGLPYLAQSMKLDVWATPFPRGLIEHKISEHSNLQTMKFHDIKPGKKFKVGPFTFDPIPVQHSIIESLGFAIETPVGTLIHTGDFKHDETDAGGPVKDFARFHEWGDKGVLLLLSDSTNAERLGHTITEEEVVLAFGDFFRDQKGRLLVAMFASNIRRIENLLWLAKKMGKRVAFEGRSMHSYVHLAHEQGSMKLPDDTIILAEDVEDYPDDQVILFLTGSQAEPQSALVRIATGVHKTVHIKPTDRVLMSSRFIPGNERAITNMIDSLYRQGAEVVYESVHHIHVSGHGYQEELAMMLKATRPKFFVPIHGEYRHLAMHAKLAKANGVREDHICVIEDGQPVEFGKNDFKLGERLELQKGIVVSGSYMNSDPTLFTQRAALAKTGIVFVTLMRKAGHRKKLAYAPQVAAYGILLESGRDITDVMEDAERHLEDKYPEMLKEEELAEALRIETRRFFKRYSAMKPVVLSVILDI